MKLNQYQFTFRKKIQPQAIIEDIRATARDDSNQLDLFSDFNGIEFQDLIDFYQHEQNWTNRMILGDSLLVMNSLAEKEKLKGQVQMIYIDPPYGIKFGSNWQVSTRKRDVKDGKVEAVTRQPEQIKAFRDTWELGIHSYLSYLRDRLTVVHELLTESGSIFVQIGDENVHLVRCLMDEVFGSENFFAQISFRKSSPLGSKGLMGVYDILLWYAKEKSLCKYRQLFVQKFYGKDTPFTMGDLKSSGYTPSCMYDFKFRGQIVKSQRKSWRTTPEGMKNLILADRLVSTKGEIPRYKHLASDFPMQEINNLWNDTAGATDMKYVVETSNKVVQRCLLMTTDPGDLVLDPTCGSGTTAYVAEQWGRRWITIDTSRVALSLARTLLMEGKYPYYLLTDSPAGVMKEAELMNDSNRAVNAKTSRNIKKGFVYKRVPHITLKSIASNPEIDDIHAKWQEHLEPLRAEINSLAGENWEEWEIPRPESAQYSSADESANYKRTTEKTDKESVAIYRTQNRECQETIEKWWELRQERQAEIDAAIARHSEGEILYDQPFEDKKRFRVTGSFTVESLSPHRVLSSDEGTNDRFSQSESLPFETMIIENLKKAGRAKYSEKGAVEI